MKRRGAAAAASLVLVGGAACAGMSRGAAAPCEPVAGVLAAGTSLAPMSGRFVLTLVGTGAPGRTIGGYIVLREAPARTPGPAPGARTALIGTTDIHLESVGALRLGDTGSSDPRAPGVAVYEQRPASGAPTVTARIGSHTTAAPTPGLQQIEGSYTVLFVRRITSSGFAGGWQSGDGRNEVRGHFCAERVG